MLLLAWRPDNPTYDLVGDIQKARDSFLIGNDPFSWCHSQLTYSEGGGYINIDTHTHVY
jgi:hypothetical protein